MRSRLLALTALVFVIGCEGPLGSGAPDGGAAGDASWWEGASDGGTSSGERDASGGGDATDASLEADAGVPELCDETLMEVPGRILFVGNSFTRTANMTGTFRQLVTASGFPTPDVEMRAVGGKTLEWHREDATTAGAPNRVGEGWDVVVLQELSTRPTDAIGDPAQFKEDATYFHDLALMAEPASQVVLYETFAREAAHPYYPRTFADPADMQAQLRFHYDDCAERYIPEHTSVVMDRPVIVARVGDAWERALGSSPPPRLHADDDYHPNANGAYLAALVFFGTIYERSTVGLPSLGVDPDLAEELQLVADETTGHTRAVPAIECPRALPVGETIAVDLGPTAATGWVAVTTVRADLTTLPSSVGTVTDTRLRARGFTGTQTGGSATNSLGLPGAVSSDSLWVGSFDGHAAALALGAQIRLERLAPGRYDVELFASRDGDDGGNGRLTRYRLGEGVRDLEVSSNRDHLARFEGVEPDASGALTIEIGVSPEGTARFGYLGALRLTRRR